MLRTLIHSLVLLSLWAVLQPSSGCAQEFSELTLVQLEKQSNAILRTRLKEEKAYVAAVVKLVGEEKIPRRLVHVGLKYVINKKKHSKNRFVYFVRVLQFLGERERITIPQFDFSIYSVRR